MSSETPNQALTATTNPPSGLPIVEKALEKRLSQADLLSPIPIKRARTGEPISRSDTNTPVPSEVSSAIDNAKERIGTTELNAPQATQPKLLIKKLSDNARLPTRGSALAAGYDVYSAHATTIPARGKGFVDTDISIAVPEGCYGRVAPRSGLAAKNFIDVGAGVVDADYRGQIKILLFNHSDIDFQVKEGDRIAQLILEKIYTPEVMEVEELSETARGSAGFGSTGVSLN